MRRSPLGLKEYPLIDLPLPLEPSVNGTIKRPHHPPFYKRRWFITSQSITIPLGITLLFILLFPVVRATVELVVKRTNLDVQLAASHNL
jgi:hypothetical protein